MESGRPATMRIFALEKQSPESWAMMPAILDRVRGFCFHYGTDVPAANIVNAITAHFIADKPTVRAWAIFNAESLVGHAITTIEDIAGVKILLFLQWEMDEGIDRVVLQNAFDMACQWGLEHGATEAQLSTFNEILQKMFSRCWGFKVHRIIMRRALRKE
jgi:hypothetical protein